MKNKLMDPIGRLMGLRYKSHPWHGIDVGEKAPDVVVCYIEIVPRDTVKYEIDKASGYLKVDRPQKYSNTIPALYGFIPQTFSSEGVAKYAMDKTGLENIKGDGDPIDVCVLTENEIVHGNIIVEARPIGGFRLIDNNQADDKIIAVLNNDAVYGKVNEIADCPELVIERLKHYFLTYKDMPGKKRDCEITHTYDSKEAKEIVMLSLEDYRHKFDSLDQVLNLV
ncbi:inorganic pyrophosphatase [Bacteroidota bacterium]